VTVPVPQIPLPLPWVTFSNPGSQWSYSFQVQNDDGTLMNIIGKTFELVIRTDQRTSGTPAATINSTSSTASGTITVNTATSTVVATLNPVATSALVANTTYSLTLWMDPGLSDATALVNGFMTVRPVTAA